jgi:hypothetical protein
MLLFLYVFNTKNFTLSQRTHVGAQNQASYPILAPKNTNYPSNSRYISLKLWFFKHASTFHHASEILSPSGK